jgi:hypothetical protein
VPVLDMWNLLNNSEIEFSIRISMCLTSYEPSSDK